MAIGFTPKHTEDISIGGLTPEEFLTIAAEAIKTLKWELSYISNCGLIAYTDKGIFSRNFEIKINIGDDVASVKSSSLGNEMMDFGANKYNITNSFRSLIA